MFNKRAIPSNAVIIQRPLLNTAFAAKLADLGFELHEDEQGLDVSVCPATGHGLVFFGENDVLGFSDKGSPDLIALCESAVKYSVRTAIVCRSADSLVKFNELQKFLSFRFRIPVFAVGDEVEAALCVRAIKLQERKELSVRTVQQDAALLTTIQVFPELGEKRAKQLLHRLPSLLLVANAAPDALSSTVGTAAAAKMHHLLRMPLNK
eukprot:m.140009 g.140009  ORF g.140009 m.140009 type:complete len:208 (+) comp20325_c1_seq4:15-638(+)